MEQLFRCWNCPKHSSGTVVLVLDTVLTHSSVTVVLVLDIVLKHSSVTVVPVLANPL